MLLKVPSIFLPPARPLPCPCVISAPGASFLAVSGSPATGGASPFHRCNAGYCHQAERKGARGETPPPRVAGAAEVLAWSPELCMPIVRRYHRRHMPALPPLSSRTQSHAQLLSAAKTISHICMPELIESEMREAGPENKDRFLSVLPTDRDN